MKKISALILLVFSVKSFAYETYFQCTVPDEAEYNKKEYKELRRILISTGRLGRVQIARGLYGFETLLPEEGFGGPFGEIYYPPVIDEGINFVKKPNYVQVTSKEYGRVQISYVCISDSMYCHGFSNYRAAFEKVLLNINGTLMRFDGDSLPLCQRFFIDYTILPE